MVYSDAGIIFLHPIEPLIQRMEETGQSVMAFLGSSSPVKARWWTKRDAFILLGCDGPEYAETVECMACFHLWKKTEFSMEFAREWLHYVQDKRIVSDQPNQLGLPNYPGFIKHRHDQSILSLLAKKRGLVLHRNPFHRKPYGALPEDQYPQMAVIPRIKAKLAETITKEVLPGWAAYVRSPYDGLQALAGLALPRNFLKSVYKRMTGLQKKRGVR